MGEDYVSVFHFSRKKESVGRCGYCHSRNTLYKNEMWAFYLTAIDYQHLIDRGWRRCGCYLYKPINQKTCCPMYTIRCDVENFRLSKSQKKVLKVLNDFLTKGNLGQEYYEKKNKEWESYLENVKGHIPAPFDIKELYPKNCGTSTPTEHGNFKQDNERTEESMLEVLEGPDSSKSSLLDMKPDNEVPRKKAKIVRLENKLKKLISKGLTEEEAKLKLKNPKSHPQISLQLEDYLMEEIDGLKKIKVNLVQTSPKSDEYLRTEDDEFSLFRKYQISVHGDEPNEVTIEGFRRFLVESPLEVSFLSEGPTSGYGSFHQQYWWNDNLIAVGVIDILPYCISSVYFFYDPDFKALSLGTYGSLREISFVRHLRISVPSIKYYYMGYYIHSCSKMKYKGNFYPSYLLCPETYTWHAIEKCVPKLATSKYSRLEEDLSKYDENELTDLRKVVVNYRGEEMCYNIYRTLNPDPEDDELFRLYGRIIGIKCAPHMLYVKI